MIPLVDLKAQYHSIKEEIGEAINAALESAQFVLGSEVAAFEEEFAAYSGGGHGIAVNSGTSALHLALLAAGRRPGDEVVTVPFHFRCNCSRDRIHRAHAPGSWISTRSRSHGPAPSSEPVITERSKAIIPVHLFGQPADMDPM